MVNRSSSNPDFRFAQDKRGQRWLPLVALMLLAFDTLAAVDARQPRQGGVGAFEPWSIGMQLSPRDEFANLAGDDRPLRANPQHDGLSQMLAQVQSVNAEQSVSGQKLAQAEPSASNRGVVQLLNQVEALNGEVNRLRGQIEVLANDVNNAQKRQRDMYVDLDTRLRRVEQGGASKKEQDALSALDERIRRLEQGSATSATIPQPVAAAAVVPPVSAPPVAVQPASTPVVTSAATTPQPSSSLPPASLSTGDQGAIQRTYDNAFSNYRLSDYPSAIRGFESFLKSYPKHALAPNAQYWIGESYFHMRDYRAAIEAQRRLLGTYPDSAKAADSLLIIGTAESNLGDNPAARKTFEELIAKYPASDSADKAKSRLAKLK